MKNTCPGWKADSAHMLWSNREHRERAGLQPAANAFELIDSNASLSVQWMLNPARAELLGASQVSFGLREKDRRNQRYSREEGILGGGMACTIMSELPAGSGNIRGTVEISASAPSANIPDSPNAVYPAGRPGLCVCPEGTAELWDRSTM